MPLSARLVDITTLHVDAIVNAANESLTPGGGVCGAIHRAAGPQLATACRGYAPRATGDACMTDAFRLPARWVIHAVGPRWRGGDHNEAELLARVYSRSLELAASRMCERVAVPAISTGIFGYPLEEATTIAVATVRAFLKTPECVVQEVIFACFDQETLDTYARCGVPVA